MKKGKLYLALLLAAVLCVCAVPVQILAQDASEEAAPEETGESETEHAAGWYEEIQSNNFAGWPQGDPVEAEAAIVMDAETGAVLYAKNIEEREYPASITKIMTVLVALERGNLSDVVTFSENAVYSIEYGSSHLGMTEGEQLTLEQCLYGIMLASANEISNAVAEHIGGSIENYVEFMNEKAQELGCTNTHFVNVHGLHDEDHYVCARDMALIMQAAVQNEKFCEIISTVEYHYPATNLVDEERYFVNHHKMISEEGMLYDGCIGGKTGYTDEAWNTLVTYAERDGQKLISVVLRCPGLYPSYSDTKTLLDYGFDNFKNVEVTNRLSDSTVITGIGDEGAEALLREAGQEDMSAAPFTADQTTKVTLPNDADKMDLKRTVDFASGTISYQYQGQVMGSSSFTYDADWAAGTEVETETETETEAQTAAAETEASDAAGFGADQVKNVLAGVGRSVGGLYGKMDTLIKEHTAAAAIVGGVLLVIFVPLLLVAVSRHRKYLYTMALREQEEEERRRLEEAIERESTEQTEEELKKGYFETAAKDGQPLDGEGPSDRKNQ